VAGVTADFAEAGLQAAFKPSAEAARADLTARFAKFGPRFEARIEAQGSGFCAAASMTFADVVLAEALSGYLEWLPDLLDETPKLKALYREVTESPGLAAYLASDLRYPMPDADYVIRVAKVLQRALPPHMPNPTRFVVG
jgi:glutathione S-transferase